MRISTKTAYVDLYNVHPLSLSQVSDFQQWLLSGMVNPNVEVAQVGQVLTIAPRTMF